MSSNEKCASCTKDQLEIRRLDAGLSECGSVECPRRRTLTASHCGQPANRSWSDELGTVLLEKVPLTSALEKRSSFSMIV